MDYVRPIYEARSGLPYVLVRAPAACVYARAHASVFSLSTDSRNFLLSRHST